VGGSIPSTTVGSETGLENGTRSGGGGWKDPREINTGSSISEDVVRGFEINMAYEIFEIQCYVLWFQTGTESKFST